MSARVLNAVLGLWLFFTPFLWRHTPTQRWNAWVVAVLAVIDALGELSGRTGLRYVNAGLGGWLIVSALAMPRLRMATVWNGVLVGLAMVLIALLSTDRQLPGRRAAER